MGKGETVWLNGSVGISLRTLRHAREILAIFETNGIAVFSIPWTTK